MKQMRLKDGTTMMVQDESSAAQIRIPVQDFAAVDTLKGQITRANLETVQMGNQEFHEVIPVSVGVFEDESGAIVAVFYCQEGIEDLIQNRIDNYTLMLIEEGVL